MGRADVVDWLLAEDEPSVRWRALRFLCGRAEDDPEVQAARADIPRRGWAARILARQGPSGAWGDPADLYRPKYVATNWMLLVLADLGVTRDDPRVAAACELWLSRFAKDDGGFNTEGGAAGHLCITGNAARALVQFGYGEHPQVRRAFQWLAAVAHEKGGWACYGTGRDLDSWEALSAFAVYPRALWTPAMERAVALGAEFFLGKKLHRQGARYEPWYRLHDPVHYYYDVLVGLEFMTALGHGGDERLGEAVELLKKRRRRDGRWNLDAVHPDVEGSQRRWYVDDPKRRPHPFALERPGRPSKRVTLRALEVLARVEGASAL